MSGVGATIELVGEVKLEVAPEVSETLGHLAVPEVVVDPNARVANNSDQLVIPRYAYNFNTQEVTIDKNQTSGS